MLHKATTSTISFSIAKYSRRGLQPGCAELGDRFQKIDGSKIEAGVGRA